MSGWFSFGSNVDKQKYDNNTPGQLSDDVSTTYNLDEEIIHDINIISNNDLNYENQTLKDQLNKQKLATKALDEECQNLKLELEKYEEYKQMTQLKNEEYMNKINKMQIKYKKQLEQTENHYQNEIKRKENEQCVFVLTIKDKEKECKTKNDQLLSMKNTVKSLQNEIKRFNTKIENKTEEIKSKEKHIINLYVFGFILFIIIFVMYFMSNYRYVEKQNKDIVCDANYSNYSILATEMEQLNNELKTVLIDKNKQIDDILNAIKASETMNAKNVQDIMQCNNNINEKNLNYNNLNEKYNVLVQTNEKITINYQNLEKQSVDINYKLEECNVNKKYIELQIAQKNKLIQQLEQQIKDKKQFLDKYNQN